MSSTHALTFCLTVGLAVIASPAAGGQPRANASAHPTGAKSRHSHDMGKGPRGAKRQGQPKGRLKDLLAKEKAGTLTEAEKTELDELRQGQGAAQQVHAAKRQAAEARFAELSSKEQAGTLTEAEKTELDALKKRRQRYADLATRDARSRASRGQRASAARSAALASYPSLASDAAAQQEFGVHAERTAKLQRAREVAVAEGRTDVVQRVDALIAKEQQRHDAWITNHKETTNGQ